MSRYYLIFILPILCWPLIGCGSGVSSKPSADDRIATRVAEDRAVAATLTAEAAQVAQLPTATDVPEATATPVSIATPVVPTATSTSPPAATPTATSTQPPPASPTPTPTLVQVVLVPVDGDDGNDFLRGSAQQNQGRNVLLPGFTPQEVSDPMVFRERLVFAVEVFDTRVGLSDGAGIQRVQFTITHDDSGDTVYRKIEEDPAYCVFGGGAPQCNVLRLNTSDNRWPAPGGQILEGGGPIRNGSHTAEIDIFAENGDQTQWRWAFQIDIPGYETLPPSDLHVDIVQIGSAGTLVFQVEAYDPAQGNTDGAGIANVDLRVLGPDGEQVWQRTEAGAPYCLFSNASGSTTCNEWNFAQNGYEWPDGQPLVPGNYTLRATAQSEDGQRQTVEAVVQIE